MESPFLFFLTSLVGFFLTLLVLEREADRGRRFGAAGLRAVLDRILLRLVAGVESVLRYVVRYVITLSWYYSLHALLRVVLRFLAGLYYAIEAVLIRNRERARALRKERRSNTHFSQIAAHKVQVKLSAAEVKKRKDKALRGQ